MMNRYWDRSQPDREEDENGFEDWEARRRNDARA